MAHWHVNTVAVVMTVKNDPKGCATTLSSLAAQLRPPDEIIVVDGGSTDGTLGVIRQYEQSMPQLSVISAPNANIARGRNIGSEAARSEIIATIDAGCSAETSWLKNLLVPFTETPAADFVAGFYKIDTHSLLESVVGLATMRGQLDPVNPESFNPSCRSLALRKDLWKRAGGWPEWINYSEDTLFDHKIRRMNVVWRFAGDAVVRWRPRASITSIAKQFYNYGTGRGHTQIDAESFVYNLRNVMLMLVAGALCLVTPWAYLILAGLAAYFLVWMYHDKAIRIARKTGRWSAYPMCLLVMWVTMFSNLAGYLIGSWQRLRERERFEYRTKAYLAGS